MIEPHDGETGRCWGCGYMLRGVESAQCPECGRPFDRADRSSMNFGRAMGRFGRWAVSPLSGWGVWLGVVACGLVWATVRWPVEGWRFSVLDLRYYGRVWEWRERWKWVTGVDGLYMAGLVLSALVAAGWMFRVVMRAFAVARYRAPRFQRGRFWGRSLLLLMVLLCMVGGVGVGWPYRLGQRYALLVPGFPLMSTGAMQWRVPSEMINPLVLTAEQENVVLRSAIMQGQGRRARVAHIHGGFDGEDSVYPGAIG